MFARDQRRRQLRLQRIQRRAILPPDQQHVAETLRRDQRGFRAFALKNRVGGDRRPVRDPRKSCQLARADRPQPVEHRLCRVARRAQQLVNPQLTVRAHHQIGERPANIDPNEHRHDYPVKQSPKYNLIWHRSPP